MDAQQHQHCRNSGRRSGELAERKQPLGWRLVGGLLIFVPLVGLSLRQWVVQGLLVPVRVVESSMAPRLLGEHMIVRCPICRRDYPLEPFDSSAEDLRAVCPLCGSLHQLDEPVAVRPGQRVLIHKWARHRTRDERWQRTAVRNPRDSTDWLVKRVVGLPGEAVQVHDGDVWIDGIRSHKSLDEFRDIGLTLFDTTGTNPAANTPPWSRWQPTSSRTAWRLAATGYVARDDPALGWSWLAFQGCELAGHRPERMLVVDDDSFNPSLSRRLHPVRDVLLDCELVGLRRGTLACRMLIGGGTAEIDWLPENGRVAFRLEGQSTASRLLPGPHTAPRVHVEMGVCDGKLHFALNRRRILTVDLPASMLAAGTGVERIEMGVHSAGLTIKRIRLLRDIYYLAAMPPGRGSESDRVQLGSDELYVLGDNSPVSEDSRYFGPVRRGDVLGGVSRWGGK